MYALSHHDNLNCTSPWELELYLVITTRTAHWSALQSELYMAMGTSAMRHDDNLNCMSSWQPKLYNIHGNLKCTSPWQMAWQLKLYITMAAWTVHHHANLNCTSQLQGELHISTKCVAQGYFKDYKTIDLFYMIDYPSIKNGLILLSNIALYTISKLFTIIWSSGLLTTCVLAVCSMYMCTSCIH